MPLLLSCVDLPGQRRLPLLFHESLSQPRQLLTDAPDRVPRGRAPHQRVPEGREVLQQAQQL